MWWWRVVLVVMALLGLLLQVTQGARYRKPPFNGSIFGKRGAPFTLDDAPPMASVCRVALEACAAWLPDTDQE
ncbi:neuropeptide SIFamide-like [Hyalella azteca]|uniref:Neuropeptide SIFamide-like n=1 Tax=Hyalella azteca TaxID=294128 RepID=A0A979FYI1_HYAAZ|nr:neuropeptide SIFamide-like [Hyalella azteca]